MRAEEKQTLSRLIAALIALLLVTSVSSRAFAQSGSAKQVQQEAALRKALMAWDTSDNAASDKYLVAFRDLDGDSRDEAIVYIIGSDWCGTGGCVTLILKQMGRSWVVVSDLATTQLPIKILNRSSHGWRSIGVWVEGGGVEPGYEAELKFDGKTYPNDFSPALAVKGDAGDILIPDDEKSAKPLYENLKVN